MRNFSLGMLVVLGSGVVACAGPRMVAPHDVVEGSETLEVSDRSSMSGALADESFKIGSFQVANVDRDWNSKSGFSVGGYSSDSTTTGYSYKLVAGAQSWTGACASKADRKGVAILGGEAAWGKTSITCECKQGDVTATVVLKAASPDTTEKVDGELDAGSAKYRVSAVTESDKSSFASGPAGFRFDGADGAVGAVEVLRPGRVWLNKRLPDAERSPVACLSAGLMLYQAPSDK